VALFFNLLLTLWAPYIGIRQHHHKPVCPTVADYTRFSELIHEEIAHGFQRDAGIFLAQTIQMLEGEGEKVQVVLVSLRLFDLKVQQEKKDLPI